MAGAVWSRASGETPASTGRARILRAAVVPRDGDTAARAGTWFALAGGTFVTVMTLLVPTYTSGTLPAQAATMSVAVVLLCIGALGWFRRAAVPVLTWSALPALAVLAVVGLDLLSKDASAGAQIFFLWPVLYAALLLPGPGAYAVMVMVIVGEVVVVGTLDPLKLAVNDGAAVLTTLIVMGVFVERLRDRVDSLLERLAVLARRDALTGLPNRRAFDEELASAFEAAVAGGRPLSVLAIDLDDLKTINDRSGHEGGDAALREVADGLREATRSGDLVARVGGDEFAAILPDCAAVDAGRRAQDLRARLMLRSGLNGQGTTVSIGVAAWPSNAGDAASLMRAADLALYEAKRAGRDRVVRATAPDPVG